MTPDFAELTTEVVSDLPSFLALHDEWETLRSRARFASVFLSHKWLRLSWEQRWRRFPNRLRIVLVRDQGQLVMAGAFVVHLFNGWPAVHFLDSGSPQSDDLLYLPSDGVDLRAQALLAALRRSLPMPMTLRANRLRDSSPILTGATGIGWTTRIRHSVVDATLDMTRYNDSHAYVQSLSKNARSLYRRRMRKLSELDRFSFRNETGEDRLHVVKWLLDRKREWLARKGTEAPWLADRSYDRFIEPLLRGDDAPPYWALTFRTGETIIAAKLCFLERDTLYFSKVTHDPEFDRFSPGFVLNIEMVREAMAAGFATIDMGQGNYETKSRLTNQQYNVLKTRIQMR